MFVSHVQVIGLIHFLLVPATSKLPCGGMINLGGEA